ncbi:MAG: hypothetical protein FWD58_00405 [Firmicutes bacterium]|nr:hypothetical protein [Bacillota bacterium]
MINQDELNQIEQRAQSLIDGIECTPADKKFEELRFKVSARAENADAVSRAIKPAVSQARRSRFIAAFSVGGFMAAAASVFLIILFAVILPGMVNPDGDRFPPSGNEKAYYTDADLTPSEVEISTVRQSYSVLVIPGIDAARMQELEQAYNARADQSQDLCDSMPATSLPGMAPAPDYDAANPGESSNAVPPPGDGTASSGESAETSPEVKPPDIEPLEKFFFLRESAMFCPAERAGQPVYVKLVYGIVGSDTEVLEIRIVFADNYTFDGQKNYDGLDGEHMDAADRFVCAYRLDADGDGANVLYARFSYGGAVYYISYTAASPDLAAVLALME